MSRPLPDLSKAAPFSGMPRHPMNAFEPTDDECRDCGAPIYPGDCDPDDAVLCAACRSDIEDWRVER